MTEKTKSIIDNFKSHFTEDNFKVLKIEDWRNIFSKELSQIFSTRPYAINPKYLYRSRINIDSNNKSVKFFVNTRDLWSAPRTKINKQGRCNIKGQSRLYCSTSPTTTLFEVKPATGSEFTVIEYKILNDIKPLGIVGVKEVLTIGKDYYEIFKNHFVNSSDETKFIDDILSGIFKSKTENTKSFPIYNLTNAVTQIFLNNQKDDFMSKSSKPPKCIGLIYPSVETASVLGANMVLEAMAVKNYLKPNIVYKYKTIKRHDEHSYEILLTHQTKKIFPNGELAWELKQDSKIEYITDLPGTNY